MSDHHRQMIEDRYAPLGAQQMLADGKRTSRVAKLLAGPLTYLRSLVLKGGWRDGRAGLIGIEVGLRTEYVPRVDRAVLEHGHLTGQRSAGPYDGLAVAITEPGDVTLTRRGIRELSPD